MTILWFFTDVGNRRNDAVRITRSAQSSRGLGFAGVLVRRTLELLARADDRGHLSDETADLLAAARCRPPRSRCWDWGGTSRTV